MLSDTEDTAMRQHSAALSLDQTLQDLADAHALLRRAEVLLSGAYDPRGDQRLGPLLRDITAHLPPPPSPPPENSEWVLAPSGLLITVLGCVRSTQPLVVYQFVASDSTTVMDLQEFLQLARPRSSWNLDGEPRP